MITAKVRGMGPGGGVVGKICWIVLGIDEVTSATWCVCFGDDILDTVMGSRWIRSVVLFAWPSEANPARSTALRQLLGQDSG